MRVLIVDDEQPARSEMRRLLKEFPEVVILDEAGDGATAVRLVEALKPDVVFLDIELPDATGLEAMERFPQPAPNVIFTTAYSEFALQALRLRATDYLLKPIDPAQLAEALGKVSQATPLDASERRLRRLGPEDRFFLRDGGRSWFAKVREVQLLESDGNYTRLHIGKDRPMVARTLKEFEEKLDPALFFRANRHQIVNLDEVERVEFNSKDDTAMFLRGGVRIEMSRRMSRLFRERMTI